MSTPLRAVNISDDEAGTDMSAHSGISQASLERRSKKRRLAEVEGRPAKSPSKRRRMRTMKGRRLSYRQDGEAFLQNAQPMTPPTSPLPPSGVVPTPHAPTPPYGTLASLIQMFDLALLFEWLGPAVDCAYDNLELQKMSETGSDLDEKFRKLHKFRILIQTLFHEWNLHLVR